MEFIQLRVTNNNIIPVSYLVKRTLFYFKSVNILALQIPLTKI